ncbi:MAG: SAM-dependent methyltransferase [Actinomycetota bacterium]|nr:SAM-dependent methyltransferase [Actinomycetota bacterium]
MSYPALGTRQADVADVSLDPRVANAARIYDCLLGGKDHYEADRQAAARLCAAVPGAAQAARDNRAFLGRVVRYLAAEAGISQFLDIGAGLPAGGQVHGVAQAVNPAAAVVYADCDRMVLAHARALLAGSPGVAVVPGDVRDPERLPARPEVAELIDFTRPTAAALLVAVHFVADADDPWAAVRYLAERLAPGSFLVRSHVTGDALAAGAAAVYDGASAPGGPRSRAGISRFFAGLELVPPGSRVAPSRRGWRYEPRGVPCRRRPQARAGPAVTSSMAGGLARSVSRLEDQAGAGDAGLPGRRAGAARRAALPGSLSSGFSPGGRVGAGLCRPRRDGTWGAAPGSFPATRSAGSRAGTTSGTSPRPAASIFTPTPW